MEILWMLLCKLLIGLDQIFMIDVIPVGVRPPFCIKDGIVSGSGCYLPKFWPRIQMLFFWMRLQQTWTFIIRDSCSLLVEIWHEKGKRAGCGA